MLDLVLNLVWMAASGFGVLLFRRIGPRSGGKITPALLALGCVLILLFPEISATDDLASVYTANESFSARKYFQDGSVSQQANSLYVPAEVPVFGFVLLSPAPRLFGIVLENRTRTAATTWHRILPNRAPPFTA
jgi:hypothetical protein